MSKTKKSKLDQYAETLLAMDAERQTLSAMQTWLKDEGCVVALSSLSRFLELARSQRLQAKLLAQIASGAQQVKAVEKQFARDAAPELETLIKLHRVLILQLSTQGNSNPEFLKLADQLMRTAMEFVSGQTKAAHKERELKVSEEKLDLLKFDAAKLALKFAAQLKLISADKSLTEEDKVNAARAKLFGAA